jgi:hypothetical protein
MGGRSDAVSGICVFEAGSRLKTTEASFKWRFPWPGTARLSTPENSKG